MLEDASAQIAIPALQQPEPVNTSPNTTPRSPDISARVAAPDTVEVCCNALYGSDQATASPDSQGRHSRVYMTAVSQQHLDDVKENLTPPNHAPAACLCIHFADAAQDVATASGASLKHRFDHAEQQVSSLHQIRSARHSLASLQPLPPGEMCHSTLLPVPSSSAAAQALSHPLTQLPSHLLSHLANESVNQPAADVCLFGSPPRQPYDRQRSFWAMPADSVKQHQDKSRGVWGNMGDRQTLPDRRTPMAASHAGHPHAATQQAEEAVGGALSKDVSSEEAFKQLLESAQQQRVSAASCFPLSN